MKNKNHNFFIFPAALLIGVDVLFSMLSDIEIKRDNFLLNQRVDSVFLVPEKDKVVGCQIDTMFHFYSYKTCFIRQTQRGAKNWSYVFHYARPFPISLSFMNSYRFEMIGTGAPKFIIFSNGTIEKVN